MPFQLTYTGIARPHVSTGTFTVRIIVFSFTYGADGGYPHVAFDFADGRRCERCCSMLRGLFALPDQLSKQEIFKPLTSSVPSGISMARSGYRVPMKLHYDVYEPCPVVTVPATQ